MKSVAQCFEHNSFLDQSILSQYAWSVEATALIGPLLPIEYKRQFRAVMIEEDGRAVIYARSGAVAHTLKRNKAQIIKQLAKWQVEDILVKVFL
jgi:hypothetical protein